MARDEKPLDKGRVKVRVIEFELDGSNQTLRDSIRDIVGAIGGRPRIAPAVAAPKGDLAAPRADDDEVVVEDDGLGESEESSSETETNRSPRRRSPPRTPEILDLDFDSAKIPLAEFCGKINPTSDNEKYVVIAFWFKTFGVASEVTADHIHTAFRRMNWNTPADASQPLRNLKTRTYGYMKTGSKAGSFVITHIGENHVRTLAKDAGLTL